MVCDNTTALQAIRRPAGSSKKLGHIEKHYYYIQDKVKARMKVGHVHTEYMLADILTKPLRRQRFCELRDKLLHELPEEYYDESTKFIVDERKAQGEKSTGDDGL